ncbi:Centrosomal protein of 78 kDa [Phytophthora nicotianae]|uniref:Centrosomal protein of 78 kDa n=1 Tax=Phytophthora nicotianae TaxID=4792 RepID=A0A0W8CTE8_PHYNI|nr:Centrosomal protein of 78 kDa [Phytophthora nicotianae]
MAAPLSIEAYKRKQNVLVAKAQKRRVNTSYNHTTSTSKESYTPDQRRYLDACVEKLADPDPRLLAALREARFVLKLDRFGEEELAFNMEFLQKTKTCSQISLSLGSVTINRDLRTKFDRLSLKRAFAYENEGASIVVRGEDISRGYATSIQTIAIALGKCPALHMISLAGCGLTDKAKDHIAKIIALHGVIKDESIWSSSLRGEAPFAPASPDLLINLSRNTLGDETTEAICDALHNDKWLLGLNLGGNHLSRQGTELFIDTLSKSNQTLAVLALADMKNPVGKSTLSTLDSILYDRNRYLQQVATESREKRMALGGLLLEWGVGKDTVVEIEYLIERLSSLEAEKREMQQYVNKVETENRQLRAELEARPKSMPASGISPIEAQIIAQLETSISSLAEQVEFMEHEKQHQPPSA